MRNVEITMLVSIGKLRFFNFDLKYYGNSCKTKCLQNKLFIERYTVTLAIATVFSFVKNRLINSQ